MAISDAYKFWTDQLVDRSEGTKQAYEFRFKDFLKWTGKTANELFNLKRDSMKADDPREAAVVESLVKQYLAHLEERVSPATRRARLITIHSFFAENRVPLDHKAIKRPQGASEGSKIPSKAEIKRLLEYAKSKRARAVILTLKDCGLRPSDIVKLKWDDVTDYGEGFWGFKPLITEKRGVKSFPFIGPEATSAILALPRKSDRIFPESPETLKNHMSVVVGEAGIKNLSGHGLRKFFICELRSARVPQDWIYMMCGKATGDQGAYSEMRPERLFEAYKEAYGYLEVYGESVNMERLAKLESMLEERDSIAQEIEKNEERRSEIFLKLIELNIESLESGAKNPDVEKYVSKEAKREVLKNLERAKEQRKTMIDLMNKYKESV